MPIQAKAFKFFEPYEGFARSLKFDMNALGDFEQETGMGFGQLMSQRAIFAVVRGLLWAGFQHEDRRISPRQVGDLIQEYVTDEKFPDHDISDLLTAAFEAAQEQGAFGRAEDFRKKALAAVVKNQGEPAAVRDEVVPATLTVVSPSSRDDLDQGQ